MGRIDQSCTIRVVASPTTDFRTEVRNLLRDRLLDAAREITCGDSWAAVTMGGVATAVGVSRQSVYREFGSKDALGEAMLSRETEWFFTQVRTQLHAHPTDPAAGLAAAVETTLRTGADNPLIKAILAPSHRAGTDLLPMLTTRPEPVLQRAETTLLEQTRQLYTDIELTDTELTRLVEIVVRLTLSHLFQPADTIEHAVDQIHWILTRALPAQGT